MSRTLANRGGACGFHGAVDRVVRGSYGVRSRHVMWNVRIDRAAIAAIAVRVAATDGCLLSVFPGRR